jgi:CheY-like chemotaxis protein
MYNNPHDTGAKAGNRHPYFLYAGIDMRVVDELQTSLSLVHKRKDLKVVENGFDLICFLQDVKQGELFPDLIILSRHMDRLNGMDTIELMRTDDIYKLIPIIIFLDDADKLDTLFFERFGADIINVCSETYIEKMTATLCNWS